jgi:hypothetical protein
LDEVEFDVDQMGMELDEEVFGEYPEGWATWFASEIDGGEWESEPEFDEGSTSSGITELDEVSVEVEFGRNIGGKSMRLLHVVTHRTCIIR